MKGGVQSGQDYERKLAVTRRPSLETNPPAFVQKGMVKPKKNR